MGDNLRGLPAALLLAGVRTIVGTLWPVAPEPSRTFFTSFYRHLLGPRGALDAFAAAQRETRAVYPHYRDWAAFTFVGRWD
jgi:CHAT domain-containing protein